MKMIRLNVLLIVVLMMSYTQVLCSQERDSVISALAKYSIIDYMINKYWSDNKSISTSSLSKSLNEVAEIIEFNDYKFESEVFYSYQNFYFLRLSDETNFQLHWRNETIFAIDTSALDYEESVFLIDPDHPEKFINENLKNYFTKKEIPSIIKLYGELKSIGNENTEFFNGKNLNPFVFIDEHGYKLSNLLRYDQSLDHVSNVYKVNNASTINYYYLDFSFKNSTLEVIESLLFQLPRIKEISQENLDAKINLTQYLCRSNSQSLEK